MRILTFTSLYPNAIEPRHGIFVKNRMDYFDRIEGTSRRVIAPVQYFPLLGLNPRSRFHRYNQVPKQEIQGNIPVYHPRFLTIPGTSLINVARAMFSSADKILTDILQTGEKIDLIDGHYLYPDGVGAFRLARKHNLPLILTARGSDVNFWLEQPGQKKDIMAALEYARRIICVSAALKDRLISHGVPENKLTVIMNGVDRSIFNFNDKPDNRGEYLLTVGNLVPLKGHIYILQSLVKLPADRLVIIGAGELETKLKQQADRLGITDRVTFLPNIPHHELPGFYTRAKCTILMSSMEGMPNVALESLACGTPVVATNVGGLPEIITQNNGILLAERTTEALTDALKSAVGREWDRQRISQDMHYLDWSETARKLHGCFSEIL